MIEDNIQRKGILPFLAKLFWKKKKKNKMLYILNSKLRNLPVCNNHSVIQKGGNLFEYKMIISERFAYN